MNPEARPDASVAELLGRVATRLRQAMNPATDDTLGGLTPHQSRTLGFIEAKEADGVVARDIAEITGTRPASVSSLLQGLEQDGWIERHPDPSDSRRKTLHVTPKARDLLRRFEAGVWSGLDARLAGALDADEQATLVALLTKVDRHLAG